jgi:NAD(P)-dependent dehydrogenase (short-subunit alcohol dehydrogenase family)
MATALIVGSTDGIGLALARRLLAEGWTVVGLSRSAARVTSPTYEHVVCDVSAPGFPDELAALCDRIGAIDLCVYCAGIGDWFRVEDLPAERHVFAVNLMGAVATVEVVGGRMVAAGRGHIIGLSSLGDQLTGAAAPSYAASKAGLSMYLRSIGLALRPHGVAVTNLRFGFVDTKMAKSAVTPFRITADAAARVVLGCLRRRPLQVSYPRRMVLLTGLLRRATNLRIRLTR